MARASVVEIETSALPVVPPCIMAALLDAADSIMSDAILAKWSTPAPTPSWEDMERCRLALARYSWPVQIGGG